MLKALIIITICLCGIINVNTQEFEVPQATIEVYKPRGFKVSIPDIEGIRLFAFHGKLNQEFNGREAGQWARDIVRPKDGRWTFYDPNTKLKSGDVLYYWLTVHWWDGEKELGYYRDDEEYHVRDFINQQNKGNPHQGGGGGGNPHTTTKPPPVTTNRPSKCNTVSLTTVNGKPTCKNQLIFQEEFQTFNSSTWKKEVFIPSSPDYEFNVYMNYPENVFIKNSKLYLKPILAVNKRGENYVNEEINLGRNCTGTPGTRECSKKAESFQILPPVFTGRVRTKDSFSFRYGIIEIKAKFPKGKWIYPQLYLQPKDNVYGPSYDSGQIRIAFSYGNENLGNELQGGIILGTSMVARNYGIKKTNKNGGDWSDDFSIYQIHWTPDNIALSVDSVKYGNIETPAEGFAKEASEFKTTASQRWLDGGKNAPFDEEFYITLGLGIGGQNFPDNVDSKPWKNNSPKNVLTFWTNKDTWYDSWNENSALEVDYVRVWSL